MQIHELRSRSRQCTYEYDSIVRAIQSSTARIRAVPPSTARMVLSMVMDDCLACHTASSACHFHTMLTSFHRFPGVYRFGTGDGGCNGGARASTHQRNQRTGEDMDPTHLVAVGDDRGKRSYDKRERPKIEIGEGGQYNTTCAKCGARGHMTKMCRQEFRFSVC